MLRQEGGPAADVEERSLDGPMLVDMPGFPQRLAACLVGCKGGQMIITRPALKFHPLDRLELAAWDFQRLFGQAGTGDGTQHRAEEARPPCRCFRKGRHANLAKTVLV